MLEYVDKIVAKLSVRSEDVGVGINVRRLRRYFLSTFTVVYSMRPFPSGAVFRCYPGLWKVFLDDKNRPGCYLLGKVVQAHEIEIIFGDASETSEQQPSIFTKATSVSCVKDFYDLQFSCVKQEEAIMKLFQRAQQSCDLKKVYLVLLDIYEKHNQQELANNLLDFMTKFKKSCKVWLRSSQCNLLQGQELQPVVNRALLSMAFRREVGPCLKGSCVNSLSEQTCGAYILTNSNLVPGK